MVSSRIPDGEHRSHAGRVGAVVRRRCSLTFQCPEGSVPRDDVLGGVAVALVIVLATLPIVVPYLVVSDPNLAVRSSNLVALTLLFLLGVRWGQIVGGRAIRIASGLTVLGAALVLITIALGG